MLMNVEYEKYCALQSSLSKPLQSTRRRAAVVGRPMCILLVRRPIVAPATGPGKIGDSRRRLSGWRM
jgi:hypothetical protein